MKRPMVRPSSTLGPVELQELVGVLSTDLLSVPVRDIEGVETKPFDLQPKRFELHLVPSSWLGRCFGILPPDARRRPEGRGAL